MTQKDSVDSKFIRGLMRNSGLFSIAFGSAAMIACDINKSRVESDYVSQGIEMTLDIREEIRKNYRVPLAYHSSVLSLGGLLLLGSREN